MVRRIPPGQLTITGKRPSRYSAELLHYESGTERAFLTLVEAMPGIRSVRTQPRTMKLTVDGKQRTYTPDVEVRWFDFVTPPCDFETMIFEVKPWAILRRDYAKLVPKLRAAAAALKEEGIGFQIVTDRYIFGARLGNAERIVDFHSKQPSEALVMCALQFFDRNEHPLRIGELIDTITRAGFHEFEAWGAVWHWLGNRKLLGDLNQPVTNATVVEWWSNVIVAEHRSDCSNAPGGRESLG